MSGAAPTTSHQGGGKTLDAAMNLVPFIDLLSCCISFLLITAVWSQIAGLHIDEHSSGATTETAPVDTSPHLTLHIDADGYILTSDGETHAIPLNAGRYDDTHLGEALRAAHALRPDLADLEIRANDRIPYVDLIRAMDIALSAHFTDLTVQGKEGV